MTKRSKIMPSPNWGSMLFGAAFGIILTSAVFYLFSTSSITLEIPVKPAQDNKLVPEPQYDFYTELTKSTPEVSIKTNKTATILKSNNKPINKPVRGYLVLIGSFKSRSEADALRAKLTLQGFAAKIEDNKVLLGPFKNEKDAKDTKKQLKAECNLDSVLKELRG